MSENMAYEVVSGLTLPGHRTMIGVRTPPSYGERLDRPNAPTRSIAWTAKTRTRSRRAAARKAGDVSSSGRSAVSRSSLSQSR